jgi:hypothetical protein
MHPKKLLKWKEVRTQFKKMKDTKKKMKLQNTGKADERKLW